MLKLDRSLAIVNENRIEIDEDQLDIFNTFEGKIPEYTPSPTKPWCDVKGLYFDIETEGLDPSVHKILMIGLIDQAGVIEILPAHRNREQQAIRQFLRRVAEDHNEFIAGYNILRLESHKGTGFDLWFIEERCKLLGAAMLAEFNKVFWKRTTSLKTHSTAVLNTKSVQYYAYYVNHGKTAVIDLYHQVLAWDFVARELTSASLKKAPVQMGLRAEGDRVELTYQEMQELARTGKWDKFEEYLEDDLKDTKLVGDFLLPAIWGQKAYLPDWSFQSLSNCGNASKWNSILLNYYKLHNPPETDKKLLFKGALTYSIPGLFRNCFKLDVESLYPHMMLLYGIDSIKDPQHHQLAILDYLLWYRVSLKEKKALGTITTEDKQKESTAKVKLNSGYGSLAAQGIEYNDFIAAAFVTAYGRATYKFIFKFLEDRGLRIVSSDTDGLICSWQEEPGDAGVLARELNTALPGNDLYKVKVKLEWQADAVYVPSNKDGESLRKNYLVFANGVLKSSTGVRYVKRDVCLLERNFQKEFLTRMIYQSPSAAYDYYFSVVTTLKSGNHPIEELQITKKIAKNAKTLVEQGIGLPGEVHTFYQSPGVKKPGSRSKKRPESIATKTGAYDPDHYLDKVNDLIAEILKVVDT